MPGDLTVAGNTVFVISKVHFLRAVKFLRIIKDIESGGKCLISKNRENTFSMEYHHHS